MRRARIAIAFVLAGREERRAQDASILASGSNGGESAGRPFRHAALRYDAGLPASTAHVTPRRHPTHAAAAALGGAGARHRADHFLGQLVLSDRRARGVHSPRARDRRHRGVRKFHRRSLRVGIGRAGRRPAGRRARRAIHADRRLGAGRAGPRGARARAGYGDADGGLCAGRTGDGGLPLRSGVRDAARNLRTLVPQGGDGADAVRRVRQHRVLAAVAVPARCLRLARDVRGLCGAEPRRLRAAAPVGAAARAGHGTARRAGVGRSRRRAGPEVRPSSSGSRRRWRWRRSCRRRSRRT